ncbi:MAG: DUF1641 domain-containing protein [Rhodospirillales bacterium]|jgi:uncharacterized protein YjgD (DUF1641 family)|nr:DUF1641 domain-containing protein [Rhodospirillales bacterium]
MNQISNPYAGEMARLVQAAGEAMTDGMVERLSTTGANALEVVDRLNDAETKDAVMSLIDALTMMHRTGAITTVVEVVMMIHAARAAMTDSMVDRLMAFVEHMMTNLATEDMASMAHEAKMAMEDALESCARKPAPKSIFGLIAMMNDPDALKAINFLLSFSCKLRQRATVLGKHTD